MKIIPGFWLMIAKQCGNYINEGTFGSALLHMARFVGIFCEVCSFWDIQFCVQQTGC